MLRCDPLTALIVSVLGISLTPCFSWGFGTRSLSTFCFRHARGGDGSACKMVGGARAENKKWEYRDRAPS